MRGQTKRQLLLFILIVLILSLWLPTPYAIIEPGEAFAVHPMVEIEDSYDTERGNLLIMTVRMSFANGSRLLKALFDSQAHIYLKSTLLQGETPQEYTDKQMVYMHTSQNNAIQAAYRYAKVPYDVVVKDGVQMIQPQDEGKLVHITAGEIGGPSAGVVFALEIYNRLVAEDITKGYSIAGTGEIDPRGRIGAIGGIQYKVVTAHEAGAELFFVPTYNEELAVQQAKRINTQMRIIAVDTIDEVLNYLDELPEKRNGAS